MDAQNVLHYRRRAEELLRLGKFGMSSDLMELSDGSAKPCANASALLFVHAGIAMTDAVLVQLTGKRSTAQNHAEAAKKLEKECGRRQVVADGVKHFRRLVQTKDWFAYDDKRVSVDDAKLAQTRIENFMAWVFKSFPEIGAHEE